MGGTTARGMEPTTTKLNGMDARASAIASIKSVPCVITHVYMTVTVWGLCGAHTGNGMFSMDALRVIKKGDNHG